MDKDSYSLYDCEFPEEMTKAKTKSAGAGWVQPKSRMPEVYKKIELKEKALGIIMVPFATFISDKHSWFWEFPPESSDILPARFIKWNDQYKSYNVSTERAIRGTKPEPRQFYRLHLRIIGDKLICKEAFEMNDDSWFE